MPYGVECQRVKNKLKHVGMARGTTQPRGRQWTIYESWNSDGDALKQECRLARIVGSGTQSPTRLSEKIQRGGS